MAPAASGARVVSLVPSVTETLLGWGVVPVGVTRFCERPELRALGGTKDPDVAAVVDLAPDLVVVDREENRREDAEALAAAGLDVHVLHVRRLEDVAPALAGLAERLGLAGAPGTAPAPPRPPLAPVRRAFVPVWRRPYVTLNAATYASSLLAAVGVANAYADHPDPYPTVTLEDAAARAPDVVLAPSEPYPFSARHAAELAAVAPVEFVDGKDLFWWGTRTPGALRRLAQALGSPAGAAARG